MTALVFCAMLAGTALPKPATGERLPVLIRKVAESGRISLIAEKSSERLRPAALLTPGAPPILAFRYWEGKRRHRFSGLDLVMDDAGH